MSNASWYGAAVAIPFAAIAANSSSDYLRQLDATVAVSERSIVIENLIGDAEVLPAAGDVTQIMATIHVAGGDDKLATEMAQNIKLEADGGHVVVRYPDVHDICALPGKSRSSTNSNTRYLGRAVRIETGTTAGRCVRVDLVVRLSAGRELTLKSHIGQIEAHDINGNLMLDTGSGIITVAKHLGSLDLDTGSGDVTVSGARGKILIDTGSGDVEVTNGIGRTNVDTGSGDVKLSGSRGDVRVDTGSGDVALSDFAEGTDLDIDTGSGDAVVDGDLSQLRRLRVDTGNGDIKVLTHTAVSLELEADSGSGRVTIDVPGAHVRQTERSHAEATLGEGGGRGKLDAGSGSIEFRQAPAH
jgi:hypothetical protein